MIELAVVLAARGFVVAWGPAWFVILVMVLAALSSGRD
jgi:hypothetical protein